MRSSNPALTKNTFSNLETTGERMTLGGTINKSAMLLVLVIAGAMFSWGQAFRNPESAYTLMLIGALGGLGVGILTIFNKRLSPYTAPAYGILEGLAVGAISAVYSSLYEGIVAQAVGLTFGVFALMLWAYSSRLIRVTGRLRMGIIVATGAIALLYIINIILMFFGTSIGFIHNGGPIGILFSLVVVGIAAFNLMLDFDFIEAGAAAGAPKYMEWYGAFGLTVTLVWLYLEILRLLSKLRR